jgi:hypothetical protein
MKKLVLGALLAAVASSTGCIISDDDPIEPTDAVITARWSFTHFEDNTARSCPVGFNTTTIVSQPWDPINHRLIGSPVEDLFDCSAGRGTTDPLDGIFLVWVQVETDSGSQVYAKSESIYVDTADGDVSLDFPIFDDAGFFFLTWGLQDGGRQVDCEEAGLVGGDTGVETTATIVGSTFALTDVFECDHYFGTTAPLLADTYVVAVEAVVDGLSVGRAPALNNKTIIAPSGLTDLGHVIIPLD